MIDEKLLFRVQMRLTTREGSVSFQVQNKFSFAGYFNVTAGLEVWKLLPPPQQDRVMTIAESMFANDLNDCVCFDRSEPRSRMLLSFESIECIDSCGETLSTFTP